MSFTNRHKAIGFSAGVAAIVFVGFLSTSGQFVQGPSVTGITTSASSGLTGGCTSGTCDVSFDSTQAHTTAGLTNTAALVESGIIRPTATTGTINDYAPTGFASARYVFQDTTGNTTIQGLAGGTEGRVVTFVGIGASTISFAHENASSVAANRFQTTGSVTVLLNAASRNSVSFVYDGAQSRWVQTGLMNPTSGSSTTFNGSVSMNGGTNTVGDGTGDVLNIGGNMVGRTSTGVFGWAASTDPTAAKVAGIGLNAGGGVEINSGTLGALSSLSFGSGFPSTRIRGASTVIYGWSPAGDTAVAADTGIARNAAGQVEVNTGTASALGILVANKIYAGTIRDASTGPSLSAGCGTGATVTSGRTKFTITTNATGLGTCTATFSSAMVSATPTCAVSPRNGVDVAYTANASTIALSTGLVGGQLYDVDCTDH